MRLLFYGIILLLCVGCKPFKYDHAGPIKDKKGFTLYTETEPTSVKLPLYNEAFFDFKLDSISRSFDGVQVPWVRLSERKDEYADGAADFAKYYSYITFIDDKRVVIYIPFKADETSKDNRTIDFYNEKKRSFDYLRGYYKLNDDLTIDVEVENKRRGKLLFFTFKLAYKSFNIDGGYLKIGRARFFNPPGKELISRGRPIYPIADGQLKLKNARTTTVKGNLKLRNFNTELTNKVANTRSTKYFIDENTVKIEAGDNLEIEYGGQTFKLTGALEIEDGVFSIDTTNNNPNFLAVNEGIFYVKQSTFQTNLIDGLKLVSLKVENKAPIKGEVGEGNKHRYLYADSLFEFTPYYKMQNGLTDKINLFLELPEDIGNVQIDSIKRGATNIKYYYQKEDGSNGIWTENIPDKIETW